MGARKKLPVLADYTQAVLCHAEEDSELEMLTTLPRNTQQLCTRLFLHNCCSVQVIL